MDYEGFIESDTDRGKVTIEMYRSPVHSAWMQITCSNPMEACSVYIEIAQARELAAMLLQAADAADGLPARPDSISDVPLQYVARADNRDSLSVILGDNPVEDDGWLASDDGGG